MGLSIFIHTDKDKEIRTPDYYTNENIFMNLHWLSRSFCNFMCRQNVAEGTPELDQIGDITGVDIHPFYEMETFSCNGENDMYSEFLGLMADDLPPNIIIENIDKVLEMVNDLIGKLSAITDLSEMLDDYGYDTLGYETYFNNFNAESTGGYVNNNFGQDLRNMQRFVVYAKNKGAKSVYFYYG